MEMTRIPVVLLSCVPPDRHLDEYRALVAWELRKMDPSGESLRLGTTIEKDPDRCGRIYTSSIVSKNGTVLTEAILNLNDKWIDIPIIQSN